MSTLPGNPHADAANFRLENDFGIPDGTLVEATLAVAHELRTANLIAYTHAAGYRPSKALDDQITARLGLGGEGQ